MSGYYGDMSVGTPTPNSLSDRIRMGSPVGNNELRGYQPHAGMPLMPMQQMRANAQAFNRTENAGPGRSGWLEQHNRLMASDPAYRAKFQAFAGPKMAAMIPRPQMTTPGSRAYAALPVQQRMQVAQARGFTPTAPPAAAAPAATVNTVPAPINPNSAPGDGLHARQVPMEVPAVASDESSEPEEHHTNLQPGWAKGREFEPGKLVPGYKFVNGVIIGPNGQPAPNQRPWTIRRPSPAAAVAQRPAGGMGPMSGGFFAGTTPTVNQAMLDQSFATQQALAQAQANHANAQANILNRNPMMAAGANAVIANPGATPEQHANMIGALAAVARQFGSGQAPAPGQGVPAAVVAAQPPALASNGRTHPAATMTPFEARIELAQSGLGHMFAPDDKGHRDLTGLLHALNDQGVTADTVATWPGARAAGAVLRSDPDLLAQLREIDRQLNPNTPGYAWGLGMTAHPGRAAAMRQQVRDQLPSWLASPLNGMANAAELYWFNSPESAREKLRAQSALLHALMNATGQ